MRKTEYSDRCHGNQKRKYSDERYIVHPIRVMQICREYSDNVSVAAAALLHDVLEDTPVSIESMLNFLSTILSPSEANKTVSLVEELTDI